MTLQEQMVQYRAKNNMSLKEFADKAKLSQQTVTYVERGLQNPSRLTEAKIRVAMKSEGEE